jgi:hypothetical protein
LNEIIFSSDSHLREISGFGQCTSLCRLEIPSSVVTIGLNGFSGCTSLNDIVFSSDSHLRKIYGFQQCTSLCRIEIPSSVEQIGHYASLTSGFWGCTSLNEIYFSFNSHLKVIDGLGGCISLCRIEIPSSVEKIGWHGFRGCTSFRVVIIRAGCRMSANGGLRMIKPFLIYEEDDMKKHRNLIHLGFGRR